MAEMVVEVDITAKTGVYGIIGDPVAHSLSPLMQNAAFAASNIPAVYVPFHVCAAGLADAIAGMRALDIRGINVTIPHKESVCSLLDEIDSSAALIGAVNTIVNRSGKLVGYNTDGLGLLRSLELDLKVSLNAQSEVVILGAGGAARAAIVALAQLGVSSITVLNRTVHRAQSLIERYAAVFPQVSFAAMSLGGAMSDGQVKHDDIVENSVQLIKVFKNCHLIVNSTSIGLSGESFNVLPWTNINSNAVVYDMIYASQATPLVRAAREAGFVACDGLGMLAAQGEAAFALWTGQCAEGVMRNILENARQVSG